ncbi:NAD-dependent epimerase/dehydratase family protein [Halalkalibacter urbisdiaboli]|uniref:NAD-dependent epimerase/dehydratase family protein n=1 Tax=Halalkalibacter urbisdiaboli TaxID=1960589 RepID=UPI000B43518B|nr:NAD(P)-dependent oxidoreductase [Halalkalibacter urbisdiaboli]
MKKIAILGGAGTIGQLLAKGLRSQYEVIVMDKNLKSFPLEEVTTIQVDATNYQQLLQQIPKDADALINLLKTDTDDAIEEIATFEQMTDVFFKASYYILMAAKELNIPKVIFASSNHVTDYYEKDGKSLLGREIKVDDYPYSKGLYGLLKLASEQAGFLFSLHSSLSVINIRIGSVPKDVTYEDVVENHRLQKTLLSQTDVVNLFQAAIESDVQFGTYYGVSNNPDKPWDMSNAIAELGFESKETTSDILH